MKTKLKNALVDSAKKLIDFVEADDLRSCASALQDIQFFLDTLLRVAAFDKQTAEDVEDPKKE